MYFHIDRVNLLESVIEAVRNVRALRFGLSAGSLGSGSITEKSPIAIRYKAEPPNSLIWGRLIETRYAVL